MKFKYSLLDNLISLSSLQIDVLIALIRRSNERNAYVRGVYYQDIVKEVGCCNQSFYNSLRTLQEKGLIKFRKESELDYDVYICGNEYPQMNYSEERYVNFSFNIYQSKAWKRLKGHEKYLFFYFYKNTFRTDVGKTMKLNKKNFYDEMTKKLGVTHHVLRRYLHQLKLFYAIGTVNGNLYVTRKNILRKNEKAKRAEEKWMLGQYIVSQCQRLHIRYEEKTIEGLVELVRLKRKNFAKHGTEVVLGLILKYIEKSIEGYRPKDRELSGGYINNLVSDKVLKMSHQSEPDYEIIYGCNQLGVCF